MAARDGKRAYFGDSIAAGLKNADRGGTGDAVERRQPHAVLAAIQEADPASLAGRQVVLSTGMANAGYVDTGMVGAELDALKAKGVAMERVVVLGIGGRLRHLNGQLEKIAKERGAQFSGDYKTRGQDVHPSSYRALLRQLPKPGAKPQDAPAAAQPAPPGPATPAKPERQPSMLQAYWHGIPGAADYSNHLTRVAAMASTVHHHHGPIDNSRTASTHIGAINLHTAATDGPSIVDHLHKELRRNGITDHSDYGLA